MDNKYFCYHMHSDISNIITKVQNLDSVTKFEQYIPLAKACGMTTMGFSEHGSIMEWKRKKKTIEDAGMKYAHGIEAYLTEELEPKVRDNYHCVLYARNYDGFLELNRLVSRSFNRDDGHMYYTPRISFEELFNTSDNILVTSACIGGVLGKGSDETKNKFISFLADNKHRAFLEIGHHNNTKQREYNKYLIKLHNQTDIPLIAGVDVHALNQEHADARQLLQYNKKHRFDDEEDWELTFKDYHELTRAYAQQGSIETEVYLEAIENTNVFDDMIESYELDCSMKYPHIYNDSTNVFRQQVKDAIDNHPYALKNHTREELEAAAEEEIEVFEKTQSIDFMLLQTYLRKWEKKNGIQCGPGRGSVSGSMVAYLLDITKMDSLRFGLNFFRFSNPDRVTLADIDTDYAGKDRDRVKEFLLKDKLGLDNVRTAEIITFNTIALRGAIKDVCRADANKKSIAENQKLVTEVAQNNSYITHAEQIIELAEADIDAARKKYPDIMKFVDIVNGVIVSAGTHPSGVLVSDLPIDETVGLCSMTTTPYPVSMIDMKELDELMYVKLDILG